jgi:hypothetical protein
MGCAQRAFGLYRLAAGGRARRSVLSEPSTVRRVSWRAFRASAADLLPGDKRLFSEAPVPQPARPSVMSQQLKSHSRRARGSTTSALPPQATLSFARSTHTQHPWMVVPRALRANYDRPPGRMRFLISASAPMPSKWQSRRWVEISDGSFSAHVTTRRSRRTVRSNG